jgi:hypothetical protein
VSLQALAVEIPPDALQRFLEHVRADRSANGEIYRRDRVVLDAGSIVRHPNGMVDAWGVATRVGVLDYPEFGTRELRPHEEVMRPGSLATLRGVPLTIDHPTDDLVTADNVRELVHGWVLDVKPDGDLVRVHVRLASADVLARIQGGTVELSCGYVARFRAEKGVTADGEAYDGVQESIVYNHLALVDLARAGHVARLTLDSGARAVKLKIGTRTLDVPAFVADSIKLEAKKLTDAKASAEESVKKRADALEVGALSIDGTELILPKGMIDSILAMLGGGGGAAPAPPADAVPTEEDPNAAPPMDGRMDAKAVRELVDRQVGERLARADAAARQRGQVERVAAEILGSEYAYGDATPWKIAADAIAKVDEGAKARVDALAELAAGEKPEAMVARGQLLAKLDAAAQTFRDAIATGGALGLAIDTARRDANGKPEKRTDAVEEARRRMHDRLTGKKPADDKGKAA